MSFKKIFPVQLFFNRTTCFYRPAIAPYDRRSQNSTIFTNHDQTMHLVRQTDPQDLITGFGISLQKLPAALTHILPPHFRILLRSEEHTSELQSRGHLVCRLLLEKK